MGAIYAKILDPHKMLVAYLRQRWSKQQKQLFISLVVIDTHHSYIIIYRSNDSKKFNQEIIISRLTNYCALHAEAQVTATIDNQATKKKRKSQEIYMVRQSAYPHGQRELNISLLFHA